MKFLPKSVNKPSKFFECAIWGGLILTILAIVGAFILSNIKTGPTLPVYSQLADFSLRDQNGETISLGLLGGQVWLADVIFTRCPGQCLRMTQHLKELQAALPPDLAVEFVSITTDPAFDTPAIFKKYVQVNGLKDKHWLFLTGEKPVIKQLAVDGLKLTAMDKPASEQDSVNDLFIHSAKFVLVDKHGQVRAFFDGENLTNNQEIIAAMQSLGHEK